MIWPTDEVDFGRLLDLLHDATVQERRSIARHLHEASIRRLEATCVHIRRLSADSGQAAQTAQLECQLRAVIDDLRRIAASLDPVDTDVSRLSDSVGQLVAPFAADFGVALNIDDTEAWDLPCELKDAAYWVVVDIIRRAIRTSKCTSISLTVKYDEGIGVLLTARYDGRAQSTAPAGDRYTEQLRRRVETVGGTLVIDEGCLERMMSAQLPETRSHRAGVKVNHAFDLLRSELLRNSSLIAPA